MFYLYSTRQLQRQQQQQVISGFIAFLTRTGSKQLNMCVIVFFFVA